MVRGIRAWWSPKRASEKLAIVAIATIALLTVVVSAFALAVYSGVFFHLSKDPIAQQQQARTQSALAAQLHTGDPPEQITRFFSAQKLEYTYDSIERRYRAQVYQSADNAHNVVIEIWVDESGRFLRGEVSDEQTFL